MQDTHSQHSGCSRTIIQAVPSQPCGFEKYQKPKTQSSNGLEPHWNPEWLQFGELSNSHQCMGEQPIILAIQKIQKEQKTIPKPPSNELATSFPGRSSSAQDSNQSDPQTSSKLSRGHDHVLPARPFLKVPQSTACLAVLQAMQYCPPALRSQAASDWLAMLA